MPKKKSTTPKTPKRVKDSKIDSIQMERVVCYECGRDILPTLSLRLDGHRFCTYKHLRKYALQMARDGRLNPKLAEKYRIRKPKPTKPSAKPNMSPAIRRQVDERKKVKSKPWYEFW